MDDVIFLLDSSVNKKPTSICGPPCGRGGELVFHAGYVVSGRLLSSFSLVSVGEDGVRLLQQVIDKRVRDLRATRDAELADKLRNITHSSQEEKEVLVHNMSSKQLSPAQLKVLSHEACFNIADADLVNLVATVESILKQTGECAADLIRQQITSLVMAHKPRAIISRAEQSALETLRANTSIVILPADKGHSTVELNKTDYIQKAKALLEDRQAYLSFDDEPMKKLVTELDKTLTDIQKNKTITKSVRLAIKPIDAAAARFYGLPKNAKFRGRGSDRVARETIEAWHMGKPPSIVV
ncbi:unnamed protein product [Schistocephalus solidus]|uniref:Uncharacterized protein n=1 Tax=Schistocephalus solidus TaxID=70667 RepID=A0A183TMJ2_SCHSO|nr:unnamed protein product [Schistocephalus solidus]